VEKVEETAQKAMEKIKLTATRIYMIVRAAQGLPPEDENFQVLVHGDDIRDRTRVVHASMISRTYMRALAAKYPFEMGIWSKIADHLDHYSVSLNEGEGRREFILAQRTKGEIVIPGQPMQLPSVQTQQVLTEPTKQEGKKK